MATGQERTWKEIAEELIRNYSLMQTSNSVVRTAGYKANVDRCGTEIKEKKEKEKAEKAKI